MLDDLFKIPDAAARLITQDARVQVMLIGLILGWILKAIPRFANRFIPHAVIAAEGAAFWVLGECGDVAYDSKHPGWALVIRGACLGLTTVVAHHTIISRLEMAVPGLSDILNLGNGKIQRPPDPPPATTNNKGH